MTHFDADAIDVKSNLQNDTPHFDIYLQRNLEIIRDLLMSTKDFFFEVAAGNVAGHSATKEIGRSSVISTTPRTIWSEAVLYTYSTTADIDTLSSSNAADTHAITITGLDANFDEITQTITLNGQTAVALTTPLMRVNTALNASATASQGTLYISVSGGGLTAGVPNTIADIRSVIQLENSVSFERSTDGLFTVPAGKTAYIAFGETSATNNKPIALTFWVRAVGGVFQLIHYVDFQNSSFGVAVKLPGAVQEKSDIEARAAVDTGTANVNVNFDLILVDNIQ